MKTKAWTAACMAVILLMGAGIPCLASESDLPSTASSEPSELLADTAWYTEDTTLSEYCISTPSELLGFAQLLANRVVFFDQTVKLGADIVLNEMDVSSVSDREAASLLSWPAISDACSFQGTLDGQGYTISGLYYDAPSYSYVGLLGNILSGGADKTVTVKNLTILNSRIDVSHSSCLVGALFGNAVNCANGLMLCDLYVDVDIVCEAKPSSVGGFVGWSRKVPMSVDSCVFAGEISAPQTGSGMGGLVGYTSGGLRVSDSGVFGSLTCPTGKVGGVVGDCTSSLSIANSIVDAVISSEEETVSAFYGNATGSVALENTLYTVRSLRPIPNGAAIDGEGKYSLVKTEDLRGTKAMALLSRYGLSNWHAVKEGFVLPRGIARFADQMSEDQAEPFCTKLVGYQTAEGDNGTFRLRLVAVVDSLNYSAVGFSVRAYGEGIEEKKVNKTNTTVYASLLGNVDGTIIQYTAQELGGAYIFALNINNIPLNVGEITFEAVTYHVRGGAVTVDGKMATLTLNTDTMT